MLVLDVSNSMETEDVVPSRLKKAKHWIRGFAEQLRGDRLGLVAFAASSYVACPLTSDVDYALGTLEIMSPRMIQNQGTDLRIALETARKSLERAAEDTGGGPGGAGADPKAAATSKAIVLISDGENHEEPALEEARRLKDAGIRLYVLGIGTQKGGPIPVRDDQGVQRGYKRDRSGQAVVSQFTPDTLTQIAGAGGGRYFNVTESEDESLTILADLGAMNRTEYAERKFQVYEDRFQYPLALAILLLLLELTVPARIVATLLAVSGVLAGFAPAAQAKEPPIAAYLENQKGLEAFKDGKLEEAKRHFGAAQAQDPSISELRFNQGVAEMGEGKVDEATESFRQSAKDAIRARDPKLTSQSLFNLGGALTKKGDIGGAAKAYLGALSAARKGGDEPLAKDIRKNLELLAQEREKQKQKQSQDQKDQDKKDQDKKDQDKKDQKDQKDPKDQSGQGDKKDPAKPDDKEKDKDKGKDKDKDQDKPNPGMKQNAKQPFRSTKLNKEDADRVMSELKDKENELRAKLKRGGKGSNSEKDW
jgi:Ca-activated chloride channel family protein